MKTNTKIVLGLFGMGLTIYGFYIYNNFMILYKNIVKAFTKKPEININELSPNKISLTINYKIINSGILSADVTGQSYDIFINDKKVAAVNNKKVIHIASGEKNKNGKFIDGITMFPLTIDFNPTDITTAGQKNIISILVPSKRKDFIFSIRGTLNLKAGIISYKKLPIDISFTLADVTS